MTQTLFELSKLAQPVWVGWGMTLFVGIVAWAFWPSNKKVLDDHAMIPLRDDE